MVLTNQENETSQWAPSGLRSTNCKIMKQWDPKQTRSFHSLGQRRLAVMTCIPCSAKHYFITRNPKLTKAWTHSHLPNLKPCLEVCGLCRRKASFVHGISRPTAEIFFSDVRVETIDATYPPSHPPIWGAVVCLRTRIGCRNAYLTHFANATTYRCALHRHGLAETASFVKLGT